MSTSTRRTRDYLNFAATPWNAGPAPLVIEGFRRAGEDMMDAYQYFRDADGNVVGRAQVGDMMYHARPSHDHWHFLQFASFSLHAANTSATVRSRKQAFCLFPTDAIDLTVERADWQAWDGGGLSTALGPVTRSGCAKCSRQAGAIPTSRVSPGSPSTSRACRTAGTTLG
jgi:hypothetical protein